MYKLIISVILAITAVNVNAQVLKNPIYGTLNQGYGGYGIYSHGGKFGAIFNPNLTNDTWSLGYSATEDLTSPTSILQWTTTGVSITGTLTASGGITGSGALVVTTIDTGNGATEVFDQDQDLMTSDEVTFLTITANTGTFTQVVVNTGTFTNLVANTGTFTNLVVNTGTFTNLVVNTGTFSNIVSVSGTYTNLFSHNITANSGITAVTATVSGNSSLYTVDINSGATAGWFFGFKSRTLAEIMAIRATAKGQVYFISDSATPSIAVSTGTTELGQFGLLTIGKLQ